MKNLLSASLIVAISAFGIAAVSAQTGPAAQAQVSSGNPMDAQARMSKKMMMKKKMMMRDKKMMMMKKKRMMMKRDGM